MQEEKISGKDGTILAHVFRGQVDQPGVHFMTPPSYSLQVGRLLHKPGVKIKAHSHPHHVFPVDYFQEFLYIESGKVQIRFYDLDQEFVGERILTGGDILLQVDGGHAFEILEESSIIEVKQGPYPGDDKAKVMIATS